MGFPNNCKIYGNGALVLEKIQRRAEQSKKLKKNLKIGDIFMLKKKSFLVN